MKISLFCGDIVAAPADAICTSTNPRLSLMMGTGAAVRAAGGFEILRECEAIVAKSGPIAAGSTVVTSAGALPQRKVIHCVASDTRHQSTVAIITACVTSALVSAGTNGCGSVAMPVFGSGHARVPFARALEAMALAVRDSRTAIAEVMFVVYGSERVAEAQSVMRSVFGSEVPVSETAIVEDEPASWWD